MPTNVKAQTSINGVLNIGRNALYYEDYALSIQYFNQAISAKPYLYEPYFYRAVAKYYLGDFNGAIDDCTASLERDPFIDDTYKLRAICYIMTEQYDKAIPDYNKVISLEADNKDIWSNLVLCYTELDSLSRADDIANSMTNKWPKYDRCYIIKAQIAVQQKDTIKADSLLDKALSISPYEVDAWSAKAVLLLQRGEFSASENAYDHAITQKPKETTFYLNRALAKFRQDNLRGAMDDYNIALDISPENYQGHYNRGLLRMQVGEDNLAIADFDFVLKKHPDDRLALFNRATLLETTGNYTQAIRDYSNVLEQYPNFTIGYQNRARCYRAIGNIKQAIQDERQVVIAQLDEQFGTNKKKQYTRKQKDHDINDYEKLVVDDNDSNLLKYYNTDYRGRVQNRNVGTDLQPLFCITFSKVDNGLSERYNYAAFIEHLNVNREFFTPIYLATREAPLASEDIQKIQEADATVVEMLEKFPNSTQFLFQHALYLTVQCNYLDAESVLDKLLEIDNNHEPSLFLRGIVKIRRLDILSQDESNDKHIAGSKKTRNVQKEYDLLIRSSINDLTSAIEIDEECAYLFYNRACLYARNHEYKKAVDDFTKSISLQPNLAEAYYNRGIINANNLELVAQGCEDLSKAGELGLYSAYSLIKYFRKMQKNGK